MVMIEVDEDDKQFIFALTLQNKASGKGRIVDIVCPAGMKKPKDLAKYLKEQLPKEALKIAKPDVIENLLNL